MKSEKLTRVHIPRHIREGYNIHPGTEVHFRDLYGNLTLTIDPTCALCGSEVRLSEIHTKHICRDCIGAVVMIDGQYP